MPHYLILAQNGITARALGAVLGLVEGREHRSDTGHDNEEIVDGRLVVLPHCGRRLGVDAFETLRVRIEDALRDAKGEGLVALVDSARLDRLNPLSEAPTWESVLAMLILSFPEVHWVFGWVKSGCEVIDEKDHNLASIFSSAKRSPLFDPTGLRSYIRKNANRALGDREEADRPIPVRFLRAAAVDDEPDYALMHAYTAYRFGYMADSITSWSLMRERFAEGKAPGAHGYSLIFEDINLHFPDRPEHIHLSDFVIRGDKEHCPALGYRELSSPEPCYRIIVTGGYSGSGLDTARANKDWLGRHQPGFTGLVMKPVGSMFDLWRQAGLFARLNENAAHGLARGFHWPPRQGDGPTKASRHSAPGKLMLVASHMVRRADGLIKDANLVGECILGAVLATDALELLGFRTPTLALQALCLKHDFEVRAEVAFLGVGHHFELGRRFREMERDVEIASGYFQRRRRAMVFYDSLVTILNRIMLVFRNVGQFDEEEECLKVLRLRNRRLAFARAKTPLAWLGCAVMAYAERLIASLGALSGAMLLWMLGLASLWWSLIDGPSLGSIDGFLQALKGVLEAFIGGNLLTMSKPPDPGFFGGYRVYWLSAATSVIGYFHLGLLVSNLYSKVARK